MRNTWTALSVLSALASSSVEPLVGSSRFGFGVVGVQASSEVVNEQLASSSSSHHHDHHHIPKQYMSSTPSSEPVSRASIERDRSLHLLSARSSSSVSTEISKRRPRRVQIPKRSDSDACIDPNPANTVADRMNIAFNSSGPGYVLSLCQGEDYWLQSPVQMVANGQEISTEGYPIEQEDGSDDRATLIVSGPVSNGEGHTTAISAQCDDCSDIKIRNIRINGTRMGAGPTNGGANLELGGPTSGQLVEYVKSFDPRSWSCMHFFEGGLQCRNATVRYNDIGPCGSDAWQTWADGISVACAESHVHGNWVKGATDGGIVLFGSPGSVVENNTVWVGENTQLGGINMVDINPWGGNYTGTVVQNNTIYGGFATSSDHDHDKDSRGDNNETAIMKIGIAIGPRTWFGPQYGYNISFNGIVLNNRLSGGFGYAMGINTAVNFTVQGNTLFGNTSWIGTKGPNCTDVASLPAAEAFVVDANHVTQSSIQTANMATVPTADSLTCIVPSDGNYWPFGGQPTPWVPGEDDPYAHDSGASTGEKVALGLGIPVGIAAAAFLTWYFRRWFMARNGYPSGSGSSTTAAGGGLGMRMANARKSVVSMVLPNSQQTNNAGYQRQASGPRLPASASAGSAHDPLL